MSSRERPLETEYDPSEDTLDDRQVQAESAEEQDEGAEVSVE